MVVICVGVAFCTRVGLRPKLNHARALGVRTLVHAIGYLELCCREDWLVAWLSSVLRPRQHSIAYRLWGDGFYRSKQPTNSIKVLKEKATKEKPENANNKIHIGLCIHNNTH